MDATDLKRPYLVDAHVHIFPPDICHYRETHLERDVWFAELYTNPGARLVAAEDLIESMDQAGIDHAIACGFPWRDLELCRTHNDYLADAARRFPQRISWLATVPPCDQGAPEEAERCLQLGASGIGELNADAQGFDLGEPESLAALAELLMEIGMPVMFHVSEPLGHVYPGKGTAGPERFVRFIEAYPQLRIVGAHWGGGLPFYELMPEVAESARNVVYDSAASTYLYRRQVFRAVLDIVGPERVLFGSDYPVLRQDRFLRRTLNAGLRDEELAPVLGLNAIRVYNLHHLEVNR